MKYISYCFNKMYNKKVKVTLSDIYKLIRNKSIDKNILFIHFPKCAGTSIDHAIKQHFHSSQITELNSPGSTESAINFKIDFINFRKLLLYYELMSSDKFVTEHKFLSGHWTISIDILKKFSNEWKYVTVLRNPIERYLSNFYFDRGRLNNPIPYNIKLEQFLESNDEKVKQFGNVYVKRLTSCSHISDETIKEACNALEKFNVLGICENIGEFTNKFYKIFGKRLNIKKLNVNPYSNEEQKKELNSGVLQKINELCKPDLIVYEHCLKLLKKD